MRSDIAQLLVETPRGGGGELYREHRRRSNRDLDEAPTSQGMRRPYKNRKSFGEYFAPLKGVLRKNVGRPWAKVFSEITSSLRGGGTVIDHTRLHLLRDFVILNPVWINDKPHHPPPWYSDGPMPLNNAYYVDRQGILRLAKTRPSKHKEAPEPPPAVQINEHSAFHKIDGVWYRVWVKPLPPPGPFVAPIYDLILKKWVRCVGRQYPWIKGQGGQETHYLWQADNSYGLWELERVHGKTAMGVVRVAYRKEQISSHTIRREGLDKRK